MNTSIAVGQKKPKIASPLSSFPKDRAKVLFVGSFHFHYPGLDSHVTANREKVDVLTEAKQKELTELVNYIKEFKPTKIAIEASPEWNATKKLREYKQGAHRAERDERYQLAMRIANELKADTIYSIDDDPMLSDLVKLDSSYFNQLSKDYDYKSDDHYSKIYKKWYKNDDSLRLTLNLLEYFKYTNSKVYHRLAHGAYLVGDFKLENKRGADMLAVGWYSRNLRIFRKLQEITEGTTDRILVIYGNGHGSILRDLIESSPEYEFVDFDKIGQFSR